jgi:3-deoxy-D-manno-octulosonic-acid transferase
VDEGRTLKGRRSSREEVSVINEIGEANEAWNTVQVAIIGNIKTGGANPIGSYSDGCKTLKGNQPQEWQSKSSATQL